MKVFMKCFTVTVILSISVLCLLILYIFRYSGLDLNTIKLFDDNKLQPPKMTEESPIVVLETTMGVIEFELYWKHAPKTCKNFAELAKVGYYNNVIFHRIISDFMIQGGDPTGTGRGGSSIYGRHFEDEIHPDLKHSGAGILSMANSGPNSNGSQFFITLAPTQWLDGKHTIFGRVSSGMHVVQRISKVQTDSNDRPVDEVKIVKAYVKQYMN